MTRSNGNTRQDAGSSARFADCLLFFVLACILSWSLWIPVILSQHGLLPYTIHPNPIGSFGPALAALIMVFWRRRTGGVKDLLRRLFWWRLPVSTYLFVVFVAPATFLAALLLSSAMGESLYLSETIASWREELSQTLMLFILILFLGGPLGEEIGWRGYALPILQSRTRPLTASLMIALAWWIWHLPLFWMEGASQHGAGLIWFAVAVICESVLFTWLYNANGGGLLAVLLYHTVFNVSSYRIESAWPAVAGSLSYEVALTVGFVITAAVVVLLTRGALGYGKVDS